MMTRQFACVLLCCTATPVAAARLEAIDAMTPPRIVGLWQWTDPAACSESYEYRSDGSGQVISAGETTDVSYVLSPVPVADDFFELTVTILHNSGGKDCLGQDADDTGESYRVYLRFDLGEDRHLVCYRPDPGQCFGPLHRQPAPERAR